MEPRSWNEAITQYEIQKRQEVPELPKHKIIGRAPPASVAAEPNSTASPVNPVLSDVVVERYQRHGWGNYSQRTLNRGEATSASSRGGRKMGINDNETKLATRMFQMLGPETATSSSSSSSSTSSSSSSTNERQRKVSFADERRPAAEVEVAAHTPYPDEWMGHHLLNPNKGKRAMATTGDDMSTSSFKIHEVGKVTDDSWLGNIMVDPAKGKGNVPDPARTKGRDNLFDHMNQAPLRKTPEGKLHPEEMDSWIGNKLHSTGKGRMPLQAPCEAFKEDFYEVMNQSNPEVRNCEAAMEALKLKPQAAHSVVKEVINGTYEEKVAPEGKKILDCIHAIEAPDAIKMVPRPREEEVKGHHQRRHYAAGKGRGDLLNWYDSELVKFNVSID